MIPSPMFLIWSVEYPDESYSGLRIAYSEREICQKNHQIIYVKGVQIGGAQIIMAAVHHCRPGDGTGKHSAILSDSRKANSRLCWLPA